MRGVQIQQDHRQALALCGLSLVNYAFFYVISIVLARSLSVRDFADYNVAVSTVLTLTAMATLGLEKYAIRCLPALQQKEDWSHSYGFLLFSRRRILTWSFTLAVLLGVVLVGLRLLLGREYHSAIMLATLFLPVIALFQFVLDVVTAYGGQLQAVTIYRLVFPILLLVFNAVIWVSPLPSNAISATICYGSAWIAALAALLALAKQRVPSAVWRAESAERPRPWMTGAIRLLAGSFLLTMFAQTGVIVLGIVHPNQPVVSAYAVAFQTGTFVVLLATSTNRIYSPLISRLLETGDAEGLQGAARRRLTLIAPLSSIYLILIFTFGRSILAMFGQEFVSAYSALCVVATGASISTFFSLAPTYLQFADRSRVVLTAMAIAVVLQVALCFTLGYNFGALGAAIAYAVPISVLYLGLKLYAIRQLSHSRRENGPQ